MLRRRALYFLSALALAAALGGAARAQGSGGVVYGVLVDNSASLESQRPRVLALGEAVVRRLSRRGPVALFSYAAQPDGATGAGVAPVAGWSRDGPALAAHVGRLAAGLEGSTNLVASVRLMLGELEAKAAAEGGAPVEKVIVLVTDGEHRILWPEGRRLIGHDEENYERKKREGELVKALRAAGVRVYAVGLVEGLGERTMTAMASAGVKNRRDHAESFLKKITKETGGRVVFPGTKKQDVEAVLDELLAP